MEPDFFTRLKEIRTLIEASGYDDEFEKRCCEFANSWESDKDTRQAWPVNKQLATLRLVSDDPNNPTLYGTLMNLREIIANGTRTPQPEQELKRLASQFVALHNDLLQLWGFGKMFGKVLLRGEKEIQRADYLIKSHGIKITMQQMAEANTPYCCQMHHPDPSINTIVANGGTPEEAFNIAFADAQTQWPQYFSR